MDPPAVDVQGQAYRAHQQLYISDRSRVLGVEVLGRVPKPALPGEAPGVGSRRERRTCTQQGLGPATRTWIGSFPMLPNAVSAQSYSWGSASNRSHAAARTSSFPNTRSNANRLPRW